MITEDLTITINAELKKNHSYVYLAVFDNSRWVPVHWGKIQGNKVTFKNMGKNIVYLPVYYSQSGIVAASEPFLFTKFGEVKQIKADPILVEESYERD